MTAASAFSCILTTCDVSVSRSLKVEVYFLNGFAFEAHGAPFNFIQMIDLSKHPFQKCGRITYR